MLNFTLTTLKQTLKTRLNISIQIKRVILHNNSFVYVQNFKITFDQRFQIKNCSLERIPVSSTI